MCIRDRYTLELLEIVREWLIDLTMAVHIEEMKRRDGETEEKSYPVFLMEFDDEWKV